jgi:putative DNA primase/helicase
MDATFNQHVIHDNQLFYGQADKWTWLSNAIWVRAQVNGEQGCGRLLEFLDNRWRAHQQIVQMSELAEKCEQFFAKLMNAGFICSNRKIDRASIIRYVLQSNVKDEIEQTSKTGLIGEAFAFSNKVIGPTENRVVCTAPNIREVKGSLADWQSNIARYCVGNSRLVLGVCAAFAIVF